jgi:hypothetical protein
MFGGQPRRPIAKVYRRRRADPGQAQRVQLPTFVSAQHHVSAAILATEPASRAVAEPLEAGARLKDRGPPVRRSPAGAADRVIGDLASLVGQVVACLDTRADELLYEAVSRCNGALENYLEVQRERETREDPAAAARDELMRLAHLLTAVDRADAAIVMRQIRRVLGRFDACLDT